MVKPMNLIVVTDGGGSSAFCRIRTVLTLSLCSSRHPTTPSPLVRPISRPHTLALHSSHRRSRERPHRLREAARQGGLPPLADRRAVPPDRKRYRGARGVAGAGRRAGTGTRCERHGGHGAVTGPRFDGGLDHQDVAGGNQSTPGQEVGMSAALSLRRRRRQARGDEEGSCELRCIVHVSLDVHRGLC